jgi:hypothetical protein
VPKLLSRREPEGAQQRKPHQPGVRLISARSIHILKQP